MLGLAGEPGVSIHGVCRVVGGGEGTQRVDSLTTLCCKLFYCYGARISFRRFNSRLVGVDASRHFTIFCASALNQQANAAEYAIAVSRCLFYF